MKPRKPNIGSITREEPIAKQRGPVRVKPSPKRISLHDILLNLYPDIDEKVLERVASLQSLDINSETLISDIQDIIEAITEDKNKALKVLERSDSISSVIWDLPHMSKFDVKQNLISQLEFEKIKGTTLTEPCPKCGGFEYYVESRQTGSSDEITKVITVCTNCS